MKKLKAWYWENRLELCIAAAIIPLVLGLLHYMWSGSPIPLWRVEVLDSPVQIRTITDSSFILEDGREVHLPYIKELPKDDPLIRAAIRDGVEINANGRVYGLLEHGDRLCGDPVWWSRTRFDLSELSGMLNPEGLDEDRFYPVVKEDLCNFRYVRNSYVLDPSDHEKYSTSMMWPLRKVRERFKEAEIRAELERLEREG